MSEHPDLFYRAAGSLRTLEIVIKLELRLIPAEGFVKLSYYLYSLVHDTILTLRAATQDHPVKYNDRTLFSTADGVLLTNKPTTNIPPLSLLDL